MTENKIIGWHHQFNGHEFEQALGVGDGQGSLACCSPWGHNELDMAERLNRTETISSLEEHGTGWCTLIGLTCIDKPITDKQHGVTMIVSAHQNPPLQLDSVRKEGGKLAAGQVE